MLTFGVGFAALNTGNNLQYLVLSLMLSFLVLSGFLSEAALRGVTIRRRLPREFHAESAATIGLEISNSQARVTTFAIVIEDHIRSGERAAPVGRTFVLRAGPGETETRTYRFSPERRGVIEFSGYRVSTRFPFGLFSKARLLEGEERALVYPAVDPLPPPPALTGSHSVGEGRTGVAGATGEVSGLRDHVLGDPMRRIHWRASLRRGFLAVREIESEGAPRMEVRLRTAGRSAGERFERDVRQAASDAVSLLDAGIDVSLRTDSDHVESAGGFRQRTRLLVFLATVEPDLVAAKSAA